MLYDVATVRRRRLIAPAESYFATPLPSGPSGPGTTVFTMAPDTTSSDWDDFTLRQVINSADLIDATGTQVQITVTFAASSTAGSNATVYFGKAALSGDPYDFLTGNNTLITFPTTVASGSNLSYTSNWVNLAAPFDGTANYVAAVYFSNGGGGAADLTRLPLFNVGTQWFLKAGNDASTVDATGYSVGPAGVALFATLIAVR